MIARDPTIGSVRVKQCLYIHNTMTKLLKAIYYEQALFFESDWYIYVYVGFYT